MAAPLTSLSARALVERMRSGAATAVEVMTAHLARIEALEPLVRAWAFLDKDGAMDAAARADAACAAGGPLGPLHGLPVGVKDIIDTADMPTEFGTRLHAGRRPSADATIVKRLRAAGAIVMGKTVTAEYALYAPGLTRNPHDPRCTPGGSSSGSAAAVAAGMTPLALGTQTNGSIVRPASYCGIVGYKPSLGLLPRGGILRHSTALDHLGVMARDVADAALAMDALAGRDEGDQRSFDGSPSLIAALGGERAPALAYLRGPYWSRVDASARAAIEAFVAALPMPIVTIDLPDAFAGAEAAHGDIMSAGVAQSFAADVARGRDRMPESVLRIVERGCALSAVALVEALTQRDLLRRLFMEITASYDAVLTAAATGVAPPLSAGTGDPIMATTWSLISAPAISLPLLTGESGLPLGVQLVGGPRRDGALLRAADWLMRRYAR